MICATLISKVFYKTARPCECVAWFFLLPSKVTNKFRVRYILDTRMMHYKRNANQRTMSKVALSATLLWLCIASSFVRHSEAAAATDDISIKTLPPDYSMPRFESADALLSDWEGEHWASLDADQDKVALSWTTTAEEAIFQVRQKRFIIFSPLA